MPGSLSILGSLRVDVKSHSVPLFLIVGNIMVNELALIKVYLLQWGKADLDTLIVYSRAASVRGLLTAVLVAAVLMVCILACHSSK